MLSCCGACQYEGRHCASMAAPGAMAAHLQQFRSDFGFNFDAFSPAELFARIRGATRLSHMTDPLLDKCKHSSIHQAQRTTEQITGSAIIRSNGRLPHKLVPRRPFSAINPSTSTATSAIQSHLMLPLHMIWTLRGGHVTLGCFPVNVHARGSEERMHASSTALDGMRLPVETRSRCDCILSHCDVGFGPAGRTLWLLGDSNTWHWWDSPLAEPTHCPGLICSHGQHPS